MRLLPLIVATVVSLLALPVLSATIASAQDDREQARTEFNRGLERYEAGDHRGALDAFQEAYRLAPHPNVRVNMANCYEQLDRPIEAIFHYERFLAESPEAPPAQRREVERALAALQRRTGEVSFQIQPDGALVRIDGAETRRAPILQAIRMTAGSHTLEVQMDGFVTTRREFMVEGGQPANVSIRLERGTDTAAPLPPPPDEQPVVTDPIATQPSETGDALAASGDGTGAPLEDTGGGGFYVGTPTLISAGVTGALLLTGIITGVSALGAQSDFDDAVARSNDTSLSRMDRLAARQDGLDAKDRADTLALVTDIMMIGALVGAGVTTFFFLTQEDRSQEQADGPTMGATVAATPNGGSVLLQGEF